MTRETRFRPATDRFQPLYHRGPVTTENLLAIEAAERELGTLAQDRDLATRLAQDALVRRVVGTTRLAGSPLRRETVRALLTAPPPDPGTEDRQALTAARLLERLDEHKAPRRPGDLRRLHGDLFAATMPDAGRFKTAPDFLPAPDGHTVAYVPTAPENVEAELDAALEWFHTSEEHPLVRIAVFHHELQSIHPFPDGNGRLGHAVAAVQMHRAGYPGARFAAPEHTHSHDPDAYLATLAETQGGDWNLSPWIRYYTRVLRRAYVDAVRRFVFRGTPPASLAGRALLIGTWVARRDHHRAGRTFRLREIAAAFPAVARRSLQRDLAELVAAEVLELHGAGRGATYTLHPRLRREGDAAH